MAKKLLLYSFFVVLFCPTFVQHVEAQSNRTNPSVIELSNDQDELKLFPNPASEYFQIRNDEQVRSISINNIVGKEIMKLKAEPNSMYDVSPLQKGIYIVRLLDKDGKSLKVVRFSKR